MDVVGPIDAGSSPVGDCRWAANPLDPSNTQVVTCTTSNGPSSIPANQAFTATLYGISNPTAPGTVTITVATTADTGPSDPSEPITITSPQAVSSPTILLSTESPDASNVTDTVGFTSSPTGELLREFENSITLTFTGGVNFTGASGTVYDGGTQIATCSSSSSEIVTCSVDSGPSVIPTSQALAVTLTGITNPATAGTDTVAISTTSDSATPEASTPFVIGATLSSVVSSGSPSLVGQNVTYAATMVSVDPAIDALTGNIEFFSGGTPIAGCGGSAGVPVSAAVATSAATYEDVGTYAIAAEYLGSSTYLASPVSVAINQVVDPAGTMLVAHPVSVAGSLLHLSVTFSATLTSKVTRAGLPGQSVVFHWDGGTCTGTSNARGVATCRVSVLNIIDLLLRPTYSASHAATPNDNASRDSGFVTLL
jgi:hypothetical protein